MPSISEVLVIMVLLGILVFLVAIILSMLFHFRWMVPFVPTPMPIVRTMIRLADLRPHQTVLDLGAGDARFLIEARRKEPGVNAIGYEGSPVVWMLGKVRLLFSGMKGVRFYCRNFMNADLRNADVIFVYLSMGTMRKLLQKFRSELRPGTKIISHAFRCPELEPHVTEAVPMRFGGTTKAYSYIWR